MPEAISSGKAADTAGIDLVVSARRSEVQLSRQTLVIENMRFRFGIAGAVAGFAGAGGGMPGRRDAQVAEWLMAADCKSARQ